MRRGQVSPTKRLPATVSLGISAFSMGGIANQKYAERQRLRKRQGCGTVWRKCFTPLESIPICAFLLPLNYHQNHWPEGQKDHLLYVNLTNLVQDGEQTFFDWERWEGIWMWKVNISNPATHQTIHLSQVLISPSKFCFWIWFSSKTCMDTAYQSSA